MSKIGKSLVFLLACVLTVGSCFTFVSAADNGVITVGDVEGYPGDIVEVPISITELPSDGFATATFTVTFGDNLEFVNAVQCDDNYGSITFGRPSDANAEKNRFNMLCFSGLADRNYNYTKQMATAYFRIKSSALPTDDISKNVVSVSTTDSINKDRVKVAFECDEGHVGISARSSMLGDTLVGHSLTLRGAISLNFHVSIPEELKANDEAFVEFAINGNETTVITKKLSECTTDTSGNLMLSCELPSPMWSRAVTARVSDGKGNYGENYTYSVKNYAMYMLSGNFTTDRSETDALLKELCIALLNYGGFSQKYFGYFAENEYELANGNIVHGNNSMISELVTDEYDEAILSDKTASLSGECAGIKYYGVNVAVDAATAITHYFTLDGNASDYVFKLTSSVCDETVLDPEVVDGKLSVSITDIPAAYLGIPYTVTVTPVGGGNAISVTYSVRDYMAHNLNSSANGLPDLIRAMYLYNVAAVDYFEE